MSFFHSRGMEAMQKIGQDGLAQGSVTSVVIHYPVLTTDFFKIGITQISAYHIS